MRPVFYCINNSDCITTRDHCANLCEDTLCKMKAEAIVANEKMLAVIRKYPIGGMVIVNGEPSNDIKKMIEELKE